MSKRIKIRNEKCMNKLIKNEQKIHYQIIKQTNK